MAPHCISPTARERPGNKALAERTKITAQGPFWGEDCQALFMGAERRWGEVQFSHPWEPCGIIPQGHSNSRGIRLSALGQFAILFLLMCPWMTHGFESLLTFSALIYWNTSGGRGECGRGGLQCYSISPHPLVDCALMNQQPAILRVLKKSSIGKSIQYHLWILARSFSTSHICAALTFSLLYISIKTRQEQLQYFFPLQAATSYGKHDFWCHEWEDKSHHQKLEELGENLYSENEVNWVWGSVLRLKHMNWLEFHFVNGSNSSWLQESTQVLAPICTSWESSCLIGRLLQFTFVHSPLTHWQNETNHYTKFYFFLILQNYPLLQCLL